MLIYGVHGGPSLPMNVPVITSGNTAAVTAPATAIKTITAIGAGTITFAVGGQDAGLVSINRTTGVLAFLAASVAGTYVVSLTATNQGGTSQAQTLTITVS